MKKQAKESEKLGVSGGITVGTILVLAAVGLVALFQLLGQFISDYQKERSNEITEEIKIHANDYQYIHFIDGTASYAYNTIIQFVNITKNGEATRKDGTVITQYTAHGVSLENGHVYKQARPMEYWLTQEEFNRMFLPLGKGTEVANFLCHEEGDPVYGKILMTIENSQQNDVYIIEKEDGTLAHMGVSCEIVTNYKKL